MFEAWRLGNAVEVIDDELHSLVSQSLGGVLVARVKDCGCVFGVNVVYDCLLAHELESVNPEKVCCLKQLHHVVQRNLALIRVQISEYFHQNVVADLLKLDCATRFACAFVQRAFREHSGEIRTSTEDQLVCVDALLIAFQQKGHVGKVLIADPRLQIGTQSRRRELSVMLLLGKDKVIEVVKSLNAVIPAKDVKTVFDHLTCMAKPGRWCFK